jgi:hypothetical protein
VILTPLLGLECAAQDSKADCTKEPLYALNGSAGGPIKSGVQQRTMRHSSISTTANYGDRVPADLRHAHEKVVHRALRGTARKTLQLTEALGWETGIENSPKLEYNNLQSVGTL